MKTIPVILSDQQAAACEWVIVQPGQKLPNVATLLALYADTLIGPYQAAQAQTAVTAAAQLKAKFDKAKATDTKAQILAMPDETLPAEAIT